MSTAPDANNFDFLIHDHNRGKTMREIQESFGKLVMAVRQHGKGGKLIIEASVKPANGGDARQSIISFSCATKSPGGVPYAAVYFTTDEGGVQKNDPEQPELFRPLESVPTPAPVAMAPTVPATAS